MDYLLLLQCPYLAICIISNTIQISLIISHKKSKPILMVTLSDMVTCDLLVVFRFALYFAIIPFILPLVEFEFRPIFATLNAAGVTCLVLTIVFYILIKFLVEYFQVRLRVVDITEKYQQEDVLLFVRISIAFMVLSLSSWIHITSGLSPLYYYYLIETPVPPKSSSHAVIVVTIILFLSILCLLLKCITRNEKRNLLVQEQEEELSKISIWNYFIGMSIMTITFITLIASLVINDRSVHLIVRHIYYGLFSIILPATIITKDKKLKRYSKKKVQKAFKSLYLT